jgi:hypothetical protein
MTADPSSTPSSACSATWRCAAPAPRTARASRPAGAMARAPRAASCARLRPPKSRPRCACASEHGARVVAQGANSGLVAASTPDASGSMVVLSLERLNRRIELDVHGRTVLVDGGVLLSQLNEALAARLLVSGRPRRRSADRRHGGDQHRRHAPAQVRRRAPQPARCRGRARRRPRGDAAEPAAQEQHRARQQAPVRRHHGRVRHRHARGAAESRRCRSSAPWRWWPATDGDCRVEPADGARTPNSARC